MAFRVDYMKKITESEFYRTAIIIEVLIPLPPLAEQHRIVEKLESILPMLDAFKKR